MEYSWITRQERSWEMGYPFDLKNNIYSNNSKNGAKFFSIFHTTIVSHGSQKSTNFN